jgi:hypothetical protein
VLASRLLPAARALADAVDLVLAEQPLAAPVAASTALSSAASGTARGGTPAGPRIVALDFTVSPACLLGVCSGGACHSPLCEHACHSRPA